MTEIEKRAKHHLSYETDFLGRNVSENMVCRAYIAGATEQIELAKEWLKTNYGRFDGKVEDFISDFEKAMKL